MLKKGINLWAFPAGTSYKDMFTIAKDAGFEGIELSLTEEGPLGLKSSEKDILEVKKMADDMGLQIKSFASDLAWGNPITSSDEKIRDDAVSYIKRQLEVASILNADTILLVPGYVGVDFIPNSEVIYYEDAYKRAKECISKVVDTAEKFKVAIGIENVWNKFLISAMEMRNFIDEFNSDYVGSYFDVGNVIYMGYPEQWIKVLGKRIKKVHFKDYRREVGTLSGFVDLLAGDVNYPAVVEALKEIGYDDFCTGEMIPAYKYYTYQIIYNTSASMDIILGRKKFPC
ncbi:sugar phosphate isomerase/epimerase [Brachyspira sp.]|uniref:sugar phosphate isomerase/epimerase family protein n=1 Tax=Brachyspira sp. TaxID=1977261 RepID=UPI00263747F4|nr:sugar phosphate isomerase/epimerase family protein [Brachyspira sp.]